MIGRRRMSPFVTLWEYWRDFVCIANNTDHLHRLRTTSSQADAKKTNIVAGMMPLWSKETQSKQSIVTIERQHIIILWKHTRMSTTSNPEESRMVEKNAYRETQKGVLRFSCWLLEAQPSQTWYDEGNTEACMPGIIRKHIVNDDLWNDTRLVSLFHWLNLLKLAKNGDSTAASSSRPRTESIDMTATIGFMRSDGHAILIPFLLETKIKRKLLMQWWPNKNVLAMD